jgi:excisionase family DNA binding protein
VRAAAEDGMRSSPPSRLVLHPDAAGTCFQAVHDYRRPRVIQPALDRELQAVQDLLRFVASSRQQMTLVVGAADTGQPAVVGFTTEQVAGMFGVSDHTIQREIGRGRLRAVRIGDKSVRVLRPDLDAYCASLEATVIL